MISLVAGTPLLAALIAWGIWHARRTFSLLQPGAGATWLERPTEERSAHNRVNGQLVAPLPRG